MLKRRTTTALAAALIATALAGCSTMDGMMGRMGMGSGMPDSVKRTPDGALTDARGMSLYTFDRDVAGSGRSACNGTCASNWPPLRAPQDMNARGDWSVVTRDDGAKQLAHKGRPLYLWVKDQKPGDRTGDGVNGVWRLAK